MAGYFKDAARNDWGTPEWLVGAARAALGGRIDLDPCGNPERVLPGIARTFLPPQDDGLALPWEGTVFVNPPFGKPLDAWMAKAESEAVTRGAEIVFLAPAVVSRACWHRHVPKASSICFLKGRVTFDGAQHSATFPVALIYYGSHPWVFHAAFAKHGMVIAP